ncbi:MAG: hypothetical protein EXR93_01535 [Gemmatimonadetes bacterium]|nr:hypothetical protein [Gemmatimonadota bacterium]
MIPRPRLTRIRLLAALLLAAACSGGPTTLSVEHAALGAALAKAGVLSGRMGGFSSFALSQISKNSKLTLVSDATGATAEFNAAAVLVIWDLHTTVAQFEIGWYNGIVGWNRLNVANETVDHMVTAGAAASGNVVQDRLTVQIPVLTGNIIGEATAYVKATEAIYVGSAGTYSVTSSTFGTPKACARPIDVPTPVSCVVSVGTVAGTFTYTAQRFSGTGGATLTQPSVSFSLPAVQVIISEK